MKFFASAFLFFILCFSIQLNAQSIDKDLNTILSKLSEKDKSEVLKYANYLLEISTESEEKKQERIYKADNTIPSENTIQKIMAYSRYMTATQKTPLDQLKEDNIPTTIIRFESQTLDFKKAKDGEIFQLTFRFTNTGKNPLVFYDVHAPCGCTVPNWSKDPVAPGEKGKIVVTFDTTGKKGKQTKLVKILTNTDPKEISLFIKGEIE